jgi:hypothetical protein
VDWTKVLEALAGAGPLAIVLGAACWMLWGAWQAERQGRADDNRQFDEAIHQLHEQRIADLKALVTQSRGSRDRETH